MTLKTYTKPSLKKFGAVSDLTRGNNGSNVDGGNSSASKRGNG